MTKLSDELLECNLCGLRSNNLISHITRTHKITLPDYRTTFPSAEVSRLTREQVEKMRAAKNAKDTKNKRFKADKAENHAASWTDALKCRLCNFENPASLLSHIRHRHEVSTQEYRAQFPDDVLQRNSARQNTRVADAMRRRLEDPDVMAAFLEWRSYPSEIRHWTRKGMTEDEARAMVSEFQSIASTTAWSDPATFAARNESFAGSGNPMSLTSIATRENVSESEARKLTPCFGRTGEKHPMFGKHHSEEALCKIASAHHLIRPTGRSVPEQELAHFVSTISQSMKCNQQVKRWNVDVLDEFYKLAIEHFGCMWHGHDCRSWGDLHPIYNIPIEKVRERNERKLQALKELGYTTIVVWECDWKRRRDFCEGVIKDAYDRAR